VINLNLGDTLRVIPVKESKNDYNREKTFTDPDHALVHAGDGIG
jgi:hypothetical protein